MRLYELADELDVTVRELINTLNDEYGMDLSGPKDGVNEEIAAEVRAAYLDKPLEEVRGDTSGEGSSGKIDEDFEHIKDFRGFSVLKTLGPDELDLLLEHSSRLSLEKGEVLFEEGDDGSEAFFVVLEGEIDILQDNGDEQESVNTMDREAIFGEFGLFTGEARLAGARANKNSEVLRVTREALEALKRESPDRLSGLYQEILDVMVRRVDALAQKSEKAQFWL